MDTDLAAGAALFADPARAAMLSALTGDVALPAGELAAAARISPQTASHHLAKLESAGIVRSVRQGRHRYVRLASADVARVIEALALVAPRKRVRSLRDARVGDALRAARTCYDHIAGELGVALLDGFKARGALVGEGESDLDLGPQAEPVFASLGVELPAPGRRAYARPCLDWSERRHHLAGALGAAVCDALLRQRHLVRRKDSRALRLTPAGEEALADWLPQAASSAPELQVHTRA